MDRILRSSVIWNPEEHSPLAVLPAWAELKMIIITTQSNLSILALSIWHCQKFACFFYLGFSHHEIN
jgi:hypothetical protein